MLKIIKYYCVVFCCSLGFIVSPLAAYPSSITLAWEPSPDENVAGYRIYYGTESHNYANTPVDTGNVTQYTIRGLFKNEIYYFAITSLTDDGQESELSAEVSTSSEFAGTARVFARKKQFDVCEMEEGLGDRVDVSMAFNFLSQKSNFIFESDDIRLTCREGSFTQDDDNTLEAKCFKKGPLGIFTFAMFKFSGMGNVSGDNPEAMRAEVYSIFNRKCPLYVIEMEELHPVQ